MESCKFKFQSTHPHGVRQIYLRKSIIYTMFQSTHPHGVRPSFPVTDRIFYKFQSTHPHGVRRDGHIIVKNRISVSIHAPTRGATPDKTPHIPALVYVSIHAPTRGATFVDKPSDVAPRFQSTHPHGVRRPRLRWRPHAKALVSIHAPTRGATPMRDRPEPSPEVSIHAPTRGATRSLCTEVVS